MTIWDEIDQMLPELIRQAEGGMVDRCVVRRPTGLVTDPETGVVVEGYEVVYHPDDLPHLGKCKVQAYEAHEQERESVGVSLVENRTRVDFPVGSFRTSPKDIVTILESRDPLLVGRHFLLTVEAPYKTRATAYRVFATVVVGAEVPPWLP